MKPETREPRSSHTTRRERTSKSRDAARTGPHVVDGPSAPERAGVARMVELPPNMPRTELQRPTRILLVNADPVILQRIDANLAGEGYEVVAVSSFQLAKQLLGSLAPDLLVADIRLEAFNGLHLAARSRFDHPSMPVIITHASYDRFLETQARRLGAAFIVNPLENPEFLQLVRAALDEPRHAQPARGSAAGRGANGCPPPSSRRSHQHGG